MDNGHGQYIHGHTYTHTDLNFGMVDGYLGQVCRSIPSVKGQGHPVKNQLTAHFSGMSQWQFRDASRRRCRNTTRKAMGWDVIKTCVFCHIFRWHASPCISNRNWKHMFIHVLPLHDDNPESHRKFWARRLPNGMEIWSNLPRSYCSPSLQRITILCKSISYNYCVSTTVAPLNLI